MKTIPIRDISDKGRRQGKRLKYEIGLLHTDNDYEPAEIIAKFRSYGDALTFAYNISKGNCYYKEIIIRS